MIRNFLLVSFINRSQLLQSIDTLREHYTISSSRIFVLADTDDNSKLLLSYNVDMESDLDFDQVLKNTIRVHRKKEFNTLYSLNALNHLVKEQNNGKVDPNFIIDWSRYRNCVLTTRDHGLKQINTRLEQVLNF
tara:strand:+ start:1333 stop:1734 length:402 start_codon:yes stop_codon:yes gene_type:complete